jgi:hypothetical protein
MSRTLTQWLKGSKVSQDSGKYADTANYGLYDNEEDLSGGGSSQAYAAQNNVYSNRSEYQQHQQRQQQQQQPRLGSRSHVISTKPSASHLGDEDDSDWSDDDDNAAPVKKHMDPIFEGENIKKEREIKFMNINNIWLCGQMSPQLIF